MADNTYLIAIARGAEVYDFTYQSAALADIQNFEAGAWEPYRADGTLVVGETIKPGVDEDGLSTAGSWYGSISTSHLEETTTAHLRWEGQGFTVQYSLDGGVTWGPTYVAGTPIDMNAVEAADFDVRVNFGGGLEDDTAELVRLTAYILAEQTLTSGRAIRPLTFTTDVSLSEGWGHQLSMRTDEGAVIPEGDYLTIQPDTADDENTWTRIKCIEFWARRDTAGGTFLEEEGTANRLTVGSTVLYTFPQVMVQINGVNALNTVTPTTLGEWYHYRVEFQTPTNNVIRFAQRADGSQPVGMTIMGLAVYTDVPGDTYQANVNAPVWQVVDPGTITVAELTPAVDMYAYTWSIISG